jgi:hypothetical protein
MKRPPGSAFGLGLDETPARAGAIVALGVVLAFAPWLTLSWQR